MWLKMSQDWSRWLNMAIWLHMAQSNPLWFKMAQDCPRWLKKPIWLHITPYGFIWLLKALMSIYGSKLPQMEHDGFIWLHVAQDGSILPQMAQDGYIASYSSVWPFMPQDCPILIFCWQRGWFSKVFLSFWSFVYDFWGVGGDIWRWLCRHVQ